MPRGGARAGAGSPPNLDKTIALLRRQVDWFEEAQPERRPVDLALAAINLNIQVGRLLAMAGIERSLPLTDAQRAETGRILQQIEDEDD